MSENEQMSTDEITNYSETLKEVWGILQGSRDAIHAIRQSIDFIDKVNSYAIFALDKTVIPYLEKSKGSEEKVVE